MTIKVGQLMGQNAVAVRPGTRRAEIVSAMDKYQLPAVTVLDEDNQPIGVIFEEALRGADEIAGGDGHARHDGSGGSTAHVLPRASATACGGSGRSVSDLIEAL
ncbi:CBS domain-containing protein [Herbidospora solisilvae]